MSKSNHVVHKCQILDATGWTPFQTFGRTFEVRLFLTSDECDVSRANIRVQQIDSALFPSIAVHKERIHSLQYIPVHPLIQVGVFATENHNKSHKSRMRPGWYRTRHVFLESWNIGQHICVWDSIRSCSVKVLLYFRLQFAVHVTALIRRCTGCHFLIGLKFIVSQSALKSRGIHAMDLPSKVWGVKKQLGLVHRGPIRCFVVWTKNLAAALPPCES